MQVMSFAYLNLKRMASPPSAGACFENNYYNPKYATVDKNTYRTPIQAAVAGLAMVDLPDGEKTLEKLSRVTTTPVARVSNVLILYKEAFSSFR